MKISTTTTTTLIIVFISFLFVLFSFCLGFYLYVRRRRRIRSILNEKNLLYSSPESIDAKNFIVFPLKKCPQLNETINIDSPDTSTFRSIKIVQHHFPVSEHETDVESTTFNDEHVLPSLIELFRIEFVFKLNFFLDKNQVDFEILRLTPTQTLIDESFPFLFCEIRLFIGDERCQTRKFVSKANPIDEQFRFELDRTHFDQSYFKIKIFTLDHEKRLELGQTVLVLNQIDCQGEIQTKLIQIYENRIESINRFQTTNQNMTRALICLVYEHDRCLVQIGLIKIINLENLLDRCHGENKRSFSDEIQIKISTILDGRVLIKRKSKIFDRKTNLFTYNTSLNIDYVSLNKIEIRLTICSRRSLIKMPLKPISRLEFSSRQNPTYRQTFQHWTQTLTDANRPHIHWHNLEPIDEIKKKNLF